MSQPPTVAHRIRPPPRLGDRTRKLGPLLELQDTRPKRAIPDRGAVRRPSIGANMEYFAPHHPTRHRPCYVKSSAF